MVGKDAFRTIHSLARLNACLLSLVPPNLANTSRKIIKKVLDSPAV